MTLHRNCLTAVLFMSAIAARAGTIQETFPGNFTIPTTTQPFPVPGAPNIIRWGTYPGDNTWYVTDSGFVPAPTPTAYFMVRNNQLIMGDTTPSLHPGFVFDTGASTSLAFINQIFTDEVVTGTLNTSPSSGGAVNREGVMARWDLINNFYWATVDFTTGSLLVTKFNGNGTTVPTICLILFEIPITNFSDTQSYTVTFSLMGPDLEAKAFDSTGALVAATPVIVDAQPFLQGISGVVTEVWDTAPFAPLQGSFSNFSVTAVPEPGSMQLALSVLAVFLMGRRRNWMM